MPPHRSRLRRIYAHLPLAFLALLLAKPTPPSVALGAIPVGLGVAIRVWAAGYLRKGEGLCTDGPYRLVRHPLYLGSLLAALGFAVMMNVVWGWAVILPLFALLYAAQLLDEERHLRATYGEEHAAFRASVPMLLPRPRRPAAGKGLPYRWSQARANREHYHALFTLVFVALFFLKAHFQ